MRNLILAFMVALVAVLTLTPAAFAVTVREYCANSTHKIETYNYTISVNDTTEIIYSTQTLECLNGCSDTLGKCRPNAYEMHITSFGLIMLIMAIGVLGIKYGGYYTPVVLMLLFTLTIAVYSTDVFIGNDNLLILILSIALIGMNTDEFLKYMDWKKYKSDDE